LGEGVFEGVIGTLVASSLCLLPGHHVRSIFASPCTASMMFSLAACPPKTDPSDYALKLLKLGVEIKLSSFSVDFIKYFGTTVER
jgi:hypothetical protein